MKNRKFISDSIDPKSEMKVTLNSIYFDHKPIHDKKNYIYTNY